MFAWLASVGFGLIINVPHRALFLCGISGSAGWILYWLANRIGVGRLGSNLLGALCVGILGLVFARIKKCPVTVFNIPGVVPLVPGVPAYQAVRAMVEGQLSDAEDLILRVAIVTIAIAMGFMLAQLIGEIFSRSVKIEKIRKIWYNSRCDESRKTRDAFFDRDHLDFRSQSTGSADDGLLWL